MQQFTQKEQISIVEKAKNLTATILLEQEELRRIKAEQFKKKPSMPFKEILNTPNRVEPIYPPKPTSTYSFSDHFRERITDKLAKFFGKGLSKFVTPKVIIPIVVLFLVAMIFTNSVSLMIIFSSIFSLITTPIIPVAIYLLLTFPGEKNRRTNALRNSDEYKKACEEAERIANEKYEEKKRKVAEEQAKIDARFNERMEHYNTVEIPAYNEELSNWTINKERKIAIFEEEIRLNKETLAAHYEATNIISSHYRELPILEWLYEDMSTSDHKIRYATELLDRERQRIIDEEGIKLLHNAILGVQGTINAGFNAVYSAIEEGNELQMDTIDLLSKTRRDVNIGNAIGTIQHHNTNKMLKSLLK